MNKKDTHLHIRISAKELEAIKKRSKSLDMKPSAYIRYAAAKEIKGAKLLILKTSKKG